MKELKLIVFEMRPSAVYPIGILQDFISLVYTPMFKDSGTFQLVIPFSKASFDLVLRNEDKEKLILIEDDFLGICQKVSCKQNQNSRIITIQGFLAEGLLENTFVRLPIQITEEAIPANQFLNNIFEDDPNTGYDYLYRSNWPGIVFDFENSSNKLINPGFQSGNCSLKRFIQDICNTCDIGFRIKYNKDLNNLSLVLIDYTDRTLNQTQNPVILISTKTSNIYESEFCINSQPYKNFIYAYGLFDFHGYGEEGTSTYEEPKSDIPYFVGVGYGDITYPTGIPAAARRCKISDIGKIQTQEGLPMSRLRPEVRQAFTAEAKNLLYEAALIKSYKCKIMETESSFKFNRDYYFGDKVTIIDDDFGLQMDAQIVEYTKAYSQNGETFQPIFGISQPTLNRILRQRGVI